MRRPTLPVIFRTWRGRDGGDVIALMPTLSWSDSGRFVTSYMHVGQHGGALYHDVVARSRPATRREYAPLLRELRGIYGRPGPGDTPALRLRVYQRNRRTWPSGTEICR